MRTMREVVILTLAFHGASVEKRENCLPFRLCEVLHDCSGPIFSHLHVPTADPRIHESELPVACGE